MPIDPANDNLEKAGTKPATTAAPEPTDCMLAMGHSREAGLDPFCDELRTPCVVIPDDPSERVWAIQSDRVKSWIAEKFFAETDHLIADRDINQVLRVLEGQAWKKPRRVPRDESTWDAIERNPVAIAIIIYVNQMGDFDGRTRDLYRHVSDPAIQAKLMALANKFPVNTQVFSRRLKEVIPLLKTIGLAVTIDRTDTARTCTVKMQKPTFIQEHDANCVIPSGIGKDRKTRQAGNGLGHDETDALNRRTNLNEPEITELLGQIQVVREEPLCPTN